MPKACVGTFTVPAGGILGSQTVTGIRDRSGNTFTGKGILIFAITDGKYNSPLRMEEWNTIGWSDGVTNFGSSIDSRWFASQPWRGVGTNTSYSILQTSSVFTSAWQIQGAVTGFGDGTFTYRLDQNGGSGGGFGVYYFIVWGGDDISIKAGIATRAGGGTGNQAVTGIGFAPKGGLFMASNGGLYNDGIGKQLAIGWCDTALNQYAMCSALIEGGSLLNGGSLRSGYVGLTDDTVGSAITLQASVVSWDSNGFTFNYITGQAFAYLVFGGVTTYAGTFNELTSDGAQTVTPVGGLTPTMMLFGSVGRVSSTSFTSGESFSLGAYDGVNQQAYWNGSKPSPTNSDGGGANWGAQKSLVIGLASGLTSSGLVEKGILTGSSLDAGGFHGNWTATDGTARQVIYFTFGSVVTPTVGSGLYKLVPDKKHDTVYTAFNPTQTEDVPIPMPYADTYPAGGDN